MAFPILFNPHQMSSIIIYPLRAFGITVFPSRRGKGSGSEKGLMRKERRSIRDRCRFRAG